MKTKISNLLILFAALASSVFAQPLTTTAPPPPGVTQLGYSQTGVTGFVTYYYQVVTTYSSGTTLGSVIPVQTSNGTLSMSNYNTISWTGVPGALSYSLLRFTTSAGYTGTCTCLVGTVTAPTVVENDQSNTLSSFTAAAGASAANFQLFVNTRDHAGPELRIVNLGSGPDRPTSTNELDSVAVQKVAGAGGTTAAHLVKIVIASGAPTMVTLLTSDTAPGIYYGVADDTALAGSRIDVAVAGTAPCTIDSGGVTAGHFVVVSTVTAGACADSGQTVLSSVASNLAVIGKAQQTTTSGLTFTVALIGAGGSGTGGDLLASSSLNGFCTGTVASASSTSSVYGLGSSAAATNLCASTTYGNNLGMLMPSAGTITGLYVNSSAAGSAVGSGVVTVNLNDAGQTVTCTIGTGTACNDTTHSFTFTAGQRISVEFTTQMTDTLANITVGLRVKLN